MSLSRRRSLRRGTPGHDGIPRALGIMPATSYGVAFGRIMKSLARSALCALITIQIRLGSPLGKSLGSSESRLFVFSLFARGLWLCGAVPMGEGGKVFQKSWFLNLTSPQTVGIVLSVSVIGAVVARFVHTEEVTGSNPVSRTKEPPFQGTGVLLCPPRRTLRNGPARPADRSVAPPRERQPRHGPTTNEVLP